MIKTNDLFYEYKDGTIALKDINIDLNKGSITGIIGGNGAGKSTLFLNLMGILRPTAGSIEFKNENIKYSKSYLNEYRQKISLVFQDPDKQIFYSNVFDDVAFALRNIGYSEDEVKKKVNDSLKETGIYEIKERPVHFLSYGQKKRVAIAGVIAMDCDVILLDEPTAGLDPVMTHGIAGIIRKLAAQGKKIVISSHDMNFIYDICNYVYILKKGEIVKQGTGEEVFLDEPVLKECGLEQPWLVKIHKKLGIPLFKKEEHLYKYWSEENADSSDRNQP
ncbi:MAG: ATP-binding cassette domain-containing protein [Eubacteriaceae bacterium]|nr:ATP-binding cassette domain-containing protein [Eubacteriaceae bacterium]